MTNNPTIDGVSLLPCPFCGCQAKYVPADYVDDHGQPWPFAECGPCNVGAPVEFWNKRIGFDYSAHALQSTIAQLQARITELESGRGELAGYGTLKSSGFGSWLFPTEQSAKSHLKTAMGGKPLEAEVVPLYTAPPAPAAVMLPTTEQFKDAFRATGYATHEQAWELAEAAEACLDATAALSGGK